MAKVILIRPRQRRRRQKARRDPDRTEVRHGTEPSKVAMGGRLVDVAKPRVRAVDGSGEVGLETWAALAGRDLLTEHTLVSMRTGGVDAELHVGAGAGRARCSRRRRRGVRSRSLFLAVVMLVIAGCAEAGEPPPRESEAAPTIRLPTTGSREADAPAPAVSVIDGDTLEVLLDGERERVRLIGIDTPEAGECLADVAADRLTALVAGSDVELTRDQSDRDQYGRLLRYVSVDGESVNRKLVEEGLAIARSYPPDTSLDAELAAAQREAMNAEIGLWAGDACGPPSGGSLEVVEIKADPPGDDSLVLNEEWVIIRNVGSSVADLTGWTLRDESASKRYSFPDGLELEAGAEIRVRSGCGPDSEVDLHWCVSGSAIWNNAGDTAFLLDPSGNIHHSLSY